MLLVVCGKPVLIVAMLDGRPGGVCCGLDGLGRNQSCLRVALQLFARGLVGLGLLRVARPCRWAYSP
jgi:hypothetical protein